MKIIDPINRRVDGMSTSNCRCICDNGSAYWNAYGATSSTRCGCQCQEDNPTNASANYAYATANVP